MRDSVRRAAVLIGGGGAVLGALLYPLVIVLWAVIRVLSGLSLRPTDVDLAFVGPLAVASVCCVAAAWGLGSSLPARPMTRARARVEGT